MPWVAGQVKVRAKLAIQRIRTVIEKNESLAKRSRREVASLLEQGKIETAKIRTETLILSDQHNELLELLELYLELILARFSLLELQSQRDKEPDEGVREAVCAVVYAAPRTEVRELLVIREQFMSKYGRDWAISVMDNTNGHVSQRILSKCKNETPAKDWVDLYLVEIAKAYNLSWRPDGFLDPSDNPKDAEPDTAAQQHRIMEAELLSSSAQAPENSRRDGNGGDGNDGGNFVLPAAPSAAPKLGDVRRSTTSVPIYRTNSQEPESGESASQDGLPHPPPLDPGQLSRTVVIKAVSPPSAKVPLEQPKAAPTSPTSTKFDELTKRFEALKRK